MADHRLAQGVSGGNDPSEIVSEHGEEPAGLREFFPPNRRPSAR